MTAKKFDINKMRVAFAVILSLLGLFSIGYGQKNAGADEYGSSVRITTESARKGKSVLMGTVSDPNDARIQFAKIVLYRGDKEVLKAKTNEDGEFVIYPSKPGTYSLKIMAPAFRTKLIEDLNLKAGQKVRVEAALGVGIVSGPVNVVPAEPPATKKP